MAAETREIKNPPRGKCKGEREHPDRACMLLHIYQRYHLNILKSIIYYHLLLCDKFF